MQIRYLNDELQTPAHYTIPCYLIDQILSCSFKLKLKYCKDMAINQKIYLNYSLGIIQIICIAIFYTYTCISLCNFLLVSSQPNSSILIRRPSIFNVQPKKKLSSFTPFTFIRRKKTFRVFKSIISKLSSVG